MRKKQGADASWLESGDMTIWSSLIVLYLALALATFLPTLKALVSGVSLNDGGASFKDSAFSEKGQIAP